VIEAFLETAAPRGANVVLALEIVMGIGLCLALGSLASDAFGNTPGANPPSCF
jgi:hypothetical protein